MNLKTINYLDYERDLPQKGQHILAQKRGKNLLVYQAFNPKIAEFAVENQRFGGADYSFSRMSWIKPNFLWMMFRAGWASKPGQERILAIEMSLENFERILAEAVPTSFQPQLFESENDWKTALAASEVRLQWDPDHDPRGQNLTRRAVQLGLKGDILKAFANEWVESISDVTDFVREQGQKIERSDLAELLVAEEAVVSIKNEATARRIGLDFF